MPVPRIINVAFLLGLLVLSSLAFSSAILPGAAAQGLAGAPVARACLNRAEQRAAVTDRKAVPLAAAIKSLRERGQRGEFVRAELCTRGDRLVYVLTLLARSGKVTRATVDAANGEPMTDQ
ncbi:MAG: hypothetical protein Q8M24_21585 [Pseudolabrys sp.]|nr:hypothetical protein [Pseudolabrys sp.]MDP2298042.1 hypothetical protein [Pseudolabrys sp.]